MSPLCEVCSSRGLSTASIARAAGRITPLMRFWAVKPTLRIVMPLVRTPTRIVPTTTLRTPPCPPLRPIPPSTTKEHVVDQRRIVQADVDAGDYRAYQDPDPGERESRYRPDLDLCPRRSAIRQARSAGDA